MVSLCQLQSDHYKSKLNVNICVIITNLNLTSIKVNDIWYRNRFNLTKIMRVDSSSLFWMHVISIHGSYTSNLLPNANVKKFGTAKSDTGCKSSALPSTLVITTHYYLCHNSSLRWLKPCRIGSCCTKVGTFALSTDSNCYLLRCASKNRGYNSYASE